MRKNKKIFTKFFDNSLNKKDLKLKRLKKGHLVDSILESNEEMPEEETSRDKPYYKYLYFILLFTFSILLFKLFDLQFFRGDYFLDLSKGNRIRSQIVRASRGLIFDSKGKAFVKNVANFQIIIEPFDLPKDKKQKDELVNNLASDLNMPIEEINKVVSSSSDAKDFLNPKVIKDNIDQSIALKMELKYKDFPAIAVEPVPAREYLDPDLSHLLGYISRISEDQYEKNKNTYDMNDYTGKAGMELSFEEYLKGKNGKQMIEVDAQGRIVRFLGSEEQSQPKMGNNIVTSLNDDMQKEMVNALKAGLEKGNSKAGSVVAINPKDGSILGMVSLPSFDNNLFSKGINPDQYKALLQDPLKPLFNRVISGTYPPGSVVKPVIAAAGLQERVITTSTTISDPGFLSIKNAYNPSIEYIFKDWKPGGHGSVNVIKAIAESCDIFFYQVGGGYQNFKGLGAVRLEKYFKLFGLGEKSGIDLPNEVDGLVPNEEWKKKVKKESWYTADNYHIAIGQGDLLVTPLQVASWTATVANGGILYKPRIAQKVVDSNGKIIKNFPSEVVRKDFIDSQNIDIVKRGMRSTVTSGTAKSLNSLPFEVAGKTGTAQYGPNNSKEHAWFICFAPYNDPEIALAVLVEGGGEGSIVSAPVAKQILEYYFNHK